MKCVVGFGLLGGALAFSSDRVDGIAQIPLLQDACPSNSILHNGECQPSSTTVELSDNVTFRPNISLALDESRDSAAKLKDFPWTFWPECFANENTTEAYCVFSDQNFASGRGIFIISTSSQAYAMLEKPAFTQPNALNRINQHSNPPFEQVEFPGKGRGLVANKTLQRGDQIFASTPLLITNPGMYDLSTEERLSLSYRGVESLPAKSRELFWKLLDHFKEDPVEDRINTNAFEIEINGLSAHGVFPEIAMLNHDCRPNAAYFFDEETMAHYVHATEPIYPGQEITITYINNERSRDKRMANLKANWGFDCSCSLCTQHPFITSESDTRIAQMKTLASQLDDWTSSSTATPEMAEMLVSLYEQERLWASLGTAYKHAAEAYSSFGDRYKAMQFARLAVEFGTLDKGFRDRDIGEMRKMAKEPEMSWSWKKRVGMKRFEGGCGHTH